MILLKFLSNKNTKNTVLKVIIPSNNDFFIKNNQLSISVKFNFVIIKILLIKRKLIIVKSKKNK